MLTQLAQYLPDTHKSLGFISSTTKVEHNNPYPIEITLVLQKWRQEDQKFKAILSYIGRPTLGKWNLSQQTTRFDEKN